MREKQLLVNKLIKLLHEDKYADYFFSRYEKKDLFSTFESEGFFDPNKNPKPVKSDIGYMVPQWNILEYLLKLSQGYKSKNITNKLLKIIKDTSMYKDEEVNVVDNYRTWWYFVKILNNIPLKKVPMEIFKEAMPNWLESEFDVSLPGSDLAAKLLPNYLKQTNKREILKMERFIRVLLSTNFIAKNTDVFGKVFEVRTKIDEHWLEDSFLSDETVMLISEKCTDKVVYDLADSIRDGFKKVFKDGRDYTDIWLKDLSSDQSGSDVEGLYFLSLVLRKLTLVRVEMYSDASKKIVESFLSDKYPQEIFKRIAIVAIARKFKEYNSCFETILDTPTYFDSSAFLPELAYLFKNNVNNFSAKQLKKLEKIIENGPVVYIPDNNIKEYKLHWRQKWYKRLETNPHFKKLYEDVKLQTGEDVPETEYGYGLRVQNVVNGPSPLSVEQILNLSNEKIVAFIKNFKPSGDSPHLSIGGLYDKIKEAIVADSLKFTKDLTPFKNSNFRFISVLIRGFEEAWESGKDLMWTDVFEFISDIVGSKWLWDKHPKTKDDQYRSWVLSAIGSLIQAGCKEDERSFPEYLHKDIEAIFKTLTEKMPIVKITDKNFRGVNRAWNSSEGRLIIGLIYLALEEARLMDKKNPKKKVKWSMSLQKIYDCLIKKEINEAYALLGQYLPNLYYVDEAWVKSKIKSLENTKKNILFQEFIEGYLFTGNVYKPIYQLLQNIFLRALNMNLSESRLEIRLVQNIAVGYLNEYDANQNSTVMDFIIQKGDSVQIRDISEFFWHEKKYILDKDLTSESSDEKTKQEKFRSKIIKFWDGAYKKYNDKRNNGEIFDKNDKLALSELGRLAVYLDRIDSESLAKLKLSAPYVSLDFDSEYFIHYLKRLIDIGGKKSVNDVGNIFLDMLKGSGRLLPDRKWSDIVYIVEKLYKEGAAEDSIKNLADKICIFYAEHRNYGLRELYEKYNT